MTPESAIANPAGITAGGPPPAAGTALGAGSVAALAVATHTRPMWSEAFPMKTEALPTKTEVFAVKAGKTGEISLLGAIAVRRSRRRSDWCQSLAKAAWAFAGFTLVEVLVVVSLLSLIVLALMAVFSSTQRAFRASVTQTDVLGGGRAAVDLIASDVRTMTPSDGASNGPVNFFSADNNFNYFGVSSLAYTPLPQSLPGTSNQRTNFLDYFFLLGRENTKWVGIGYAVNSANNAQLYPLYRYYAETNLSTPPVVLINNFFSLINNGQWTNLNLVLNGVVHLSVSAYDDSGYQMTNTYQLLAGNWVTNKSVLFYPAPAASPFGDVGFMFYSNAVPAAVEIDLGVLEDRALAHAEALSTYTLRTNYLSSQSGAVHLFRQRVSIPNVDTSAYQ